MTRRSIVGWLSALLTLSLLGVVAAPVSAEVDDGPAPSAEAENRYVVIMEEEPLVTQFGVDAVGGAGAASAAQGMTSSHESVVAGAGLGADAIETSLTHALNGFVVDLTDSQLDRVKSQDGVLMVLEDFLRQPQTDSSPQFLGLTRSDGGAWASGVVGEGVIVGVIDSGIWPEHPSFADDGSYSDPGVVLDESVYPACDFGNTAHNPDDAPFTCNNKLIGARQILPTYRSLIGADPDEFDSGRDDDGHGSHTASTAAGNAGVEAEIFGRDLGVISGIAPRAHIISYKGLGNLGGFTSDLAAAIDQAVADGVDVINYSVGGGAGGVGADEIAFLFAADAGVHVATSAGNSGPDPATLGDPATKPWLTTVAASSQQRFRMGRLYVSGPTNALEAAANAAPGPSSNGNQNIYRGASITEQVGTRPMIDAEFAGGDLCIPGTLDPAEVTGKIVLCRRGATARAAKSFAVLQAGGVGMVLYNNSDNDNLFTDSHWVPSLHVDNTTGLAIKADIAGRSAPLGRLRTGFNFRDRLAPSVTYFSSRGPNPVAADIIKPDLTAPGHQVLAAYSPFPDPGSSVPGQEFASISGTSMSSPHVAGLMALIDQVHPDWSAAAVKSAMMTTAEPVAKTDDRRTLGDPFDFGAGHIDPGRPAKAGSSFNPGLVYEAGFNDYLGFMCDAFPEVFADPATTCALLDSLGFPIEAVNLNYPSIGVAELAGSQTITRTVTSVDDSRSSLVYEAKVEAPPGYEVSVTPHNFRVAPGESVTYQVTITNVSAPIGEWRHGAITWEARGFSVRSPISVRGTSLAAPAIVTGSGVDGSASLPVRFGYSGDYTAAAHGLEPAVVFSDNVLQDPDQTFDPSDVDAGGAVLHEVTTSGAAALLIQMPPDATEPEADLDIFVIGPAGELVATSTSGGTDEEISLILPDDGTYSIYVHGWSSPGGDSDYDLYTWVISATPGGNMSVDSSPTSVSVGQRADVDISWAGAAAGEWHLGAISHSDASGLLGLTLVDVDNR